ncbi:uncharacterized protein LOC123010002 [Tribolium madens]|uniref:uncharacterized protein LOC123010002 n=1 Tax=Tribolium madens TaxID=41895 RepID=UPI001CF75A2F|nr:uncharacterized protein LOC123010002 [Tribolium madens]XP_044262546.1 uncharacterized protein LOC123010002 [Tribolium madens]XP_044262547.1 uncharacterized protein LOC123010002 [Tribolium madens]
MESYINLFLKTELTIIPRLLDKYIGNYYNNTLCNGTTWMFACWCILHVFFDNLLNAFLKRIKYREYIRVRLQQSLWYLGFYTTACIYCCATLIRNNLEIIKLKTPFDSSNVASGQLILGFIVVLTFYLHSAFWERLKYCHGFVASGYLCLFFFFCFSYFLRFIEGCFRLTILICSAQIALEVTRVIAIVTKRDNCRGRVLTGIFFTLSLSVFVINYGIIVPLLFGYPLVRGFTPGVTFLLTFFLTWLTIEFYSSALIKAVIHWLNHTETDDKKKKCNLDLVECSLFPPRDDATYNFLLMRKEMKEREERCLSLRKPKNKNVVFQTLKCMVAIKRKLNEKRKEASGLSETFVDKMQDEKEQETHNQNEHDESDSDSDGEVVGGKLEFNINCKNESDSCKCKQD